MRFVILMAQAVPISLYVTLETVKVAQCKVGYAHINLACVMCVCVGGYPTTFSSHRTHTMPYNRTPVYADTAHTTHTKLYTQLLYDKDRHMYWPAEDVPFTSRTTTLNEELGQVRDLKTFVVMHYFQGG